MNRLLELKEFSNSIGSDPQFVLAGGGNTSCKIADELYIKASGTSLAAITEDGFVVMNRNELKNLWEMKFSEDDDIREASVLNHIMKARRSDQLSKRPSVEVLLHDLFPQIFVIHTHPTLINGLTCSIDGAIVAEDLFAEKAIWIDEVKPGFLLANIVKEKVEAFIQKHQSPPNILFMQNHGLLTAADSIEEINSLHEYIFEIIKKKVLREPDFTVVNREYEKASSIAPAIRMALMRDESSIVIYRNNKEIDKFLNDLDSFASLNSPFTPDHIVYCRHTFLFVEYRDDLESLYTTITEHIETFAKIHKFLPKIIAVEKIGVFACGQSRREAQNALDLFLDAIKICVYTESFGGPRHMNHLLVDFIVSWEVESYRQKVALSGSNKKRLAEKIAIITGSAQGFGKGLAEEMAEEGANIVIADINFEQASENAQTLSHIYGKGKFHPIDVDLTKENEIEKMILETVLEFGGIDVFISNAGVLKAGSLNEISKSDFEFLTNVNYTAYFLCVKYCSKYMKIQNRFKSNFMMDIIQINSKSGLSGSNKNFAYAGSKFGSIGLTQSFALELAEFKIKVNAICPGNFFDGPLWAHPENGLFSQYLKAGKIPGAKTYEDVKKHYESLVPLKRGCEAKDVARAVLYVIEQLYETGQAIPVTGGQIMLN